METANLEPLPRFVLRANAAVPCNVYDRRGRILLREGTTLSETTHALLECVAVYHMPPWQQAPARTGTDDALVGDFAAIPAEEARDVVDLLRFLCESRDADADSDGAPGTDVAQDRKCVDVHLAIENPDDGSLIRRDVMLSTSNLVAGGMMVDLDCPLDNATTVYCRFETLAGSVTLRAAVEDCTLTEHGAHCVQLVFEREL